jgi:hypothetical protein
LVVRPFAAFDGWMLSRTLPADRVQVRIRTVVTLDARHGAGRRESSLWRVDPVRADMIPA